MQCIDCMFLMIYTVNFTVKSTFKELRGKYCYDLLLEARKKFAGSYHRGKNKLVDINYELVCRSWH